MPSIKVVYGEAEVNVEIKSPNMAIQDIVEAAKTAFSIPATKTNFELRYRSKPVDPLLPFRLSGILANASVELVRTAVKAPSASGEGAVTVALDYGGGKKRIESKHSPQTTLEEIIAANEGHESVISARFMNKRVERIDFASTTLSSLGLMQGSALFRLESSTSPSDSTLTAQSDDMADGSFVKVEATEATESSRPSLLDEFIDVDSQTIALVTLMKIVKNVMLNPQDAKVRSIRLSNPAVKSKLKDSVAAISLLVKAGFERRVEGGEPYMVVDNPSDNQLRQVWDELQTLADKVSVPVSERPSISSVKTPSNVNVGTSSGIAEFSFDPYKTNVVSFNNPQGSTLRVGDSGIRTLEDQVTELKAKREALMRRDAMVTERRIVAMPHSTEFNPRSFITVTEEGEESTESTEALDAAARVAISQHFRMVQEKQKKAENFQTRAMREFDLLSKSRVYTRTLIRVIFPDRSVVQALFSPLETVAVVKGILLQACPSLNDMEFSLMTGPPPQKLDPAETLESLGLVPAASLQLSVPMGTPLLIRPDILTHNPQAFNIPVPKGEPLVRPACSSGAVAAGGKPKWLKL